MHRTCAAARHGRAAVASRVLLALALGTGVACGPRGGVALPGTLNGEPSLEAESLAVTARVACSAVTSFAAEVAVTGRISGDRVRGRLLVGMASGGRVRLEALAPFGQPVFVLVATGNTATLLLPRQRQLLSDAPAHELLESLTGMRVDGADLFALLTGCVVPAARVSTGLRLPGEWWAAELDDGRATAYVRRRKEDGVPGRAPPRSRSATIGTPPTVCRGACVWSVPVEPRRWRWP
jgi:hypothetical protein